MKSSPSQCSVQYWAGEFKRGRTGLEGDPRVERPKIPTTTEIIEQVLNIVSEVPSLTKREIANALFNSDKRVLYTFIWRITYKRAVWKANATHVNNSTKTASKTICSA